MSKIGVHIQVLSRKRVLTQRFRQGSNLCFSQLPFVRGKHLFPFCILDCRLRASRLSRKADQKVASRSVHSAIFTDTRALVRETKTGRGREGRKLSLGSAFGLLSVLGIKPRLLVCRAHTLLPSGFCQLEMGTF